MKLGAMILHILKLLDDELPNRVNWLEPIDPSNAHALQTHIENTTNYTVELRYILESNGWFRSRGAHAACENLRYNISNEVVLFLHNNPLMGEWQLGVGFFAPWPKDFTASMKFGYAKALDFEPKLEESNLFWGRPICIMQITEKFSQIMYWYPERMNEKTERIVTSILKELPEGHLHVHAEDLYSGRNGHDAVNMIKRTEEEAWRKSDPVYQRNDRYGVHKILTDTEVLYVLHGHGSNQFDSRAYSTAEEVAAEAMRLGYGETLEDWESTACNTRIVHDLRRETIHSAVFLCSKLKLGQNLTEDETRVMQGFYRFLSSLVKPNAKNYAQLSEYMTQTIKRLKYDHKVDWQDAKCFAVDTSFGDTYRDKVRTTPAKKISTVRKRKCAGRYMSKLALLARIAGENRLSAHEMIDRFRARPRTRQEAMHDLMSAYS